MGGRRFSSRETLTILDLWPFDLWTRLQALFCTKIRLGKRAIHLDIVKHEGRIRTWAYQRQARENLETIGVVETAVGSGALTHC
jgi:hypothetical protein